jgi:hypothetical protein
MAKSPKQEEAEMMADAEAATAGANDAKKSAAEEMNEARNAKREAAAETAAAKKAQADAAATKKAHTKVVQKPNKLDVGFQPLRPFKLAAKFVTGTLGGTLDGMSRWGSRGFTYGGIGGILFGIANAGAVSFVGSVGIGVLGGALAGIAVGATLGALTGGFTRASRAQAREDAMDRARQVKRSGGLGVVHGDHIDRINDSNFDRQLQQNQELEYDRKTYWTDRVSQPGPDHGRGF